MKVKNVKLEWNVLLWDNNQNKVRNYNIFYHGFIERLHKEIVRKKSIKTYADLKEYIKRWAMYNYWCKCEFEIFIGDFLTKEEDFEKIDAYRQIEMNLDRITEYVINELKINFKQ